MKQTIENRQNCLLVSKDISIDIFVNSLIKTLSFFIGPIISSFPDVMGLKSVLALCTILNYCKGINVSSKHQYVIGGWIPGTPDLLIHKWKPILENYISDSVGRLYNPPIDFALIPVDYEAAQSASDLIMSNQLDFICWFPQLIIFA